MGKLEIVTASILARLDIRSFASISHAHLPLGFLGWFGLRAIWLLQQSMVSHVWLSQCRLWNDENVRSPGIFRIGAAAGGNGSNGGKIQISAHLLRCRTFLSCWTRASTLSAWRSAWSCARTASTRRPSPLSSGNSGSRARPSRERWEHHQSLLRI